MLRPKLVEAIFGHVRDNTIFMNFEHLAEISILIAKWCTKAHKEEFFKEHIDKIMANIPYSSDKLFVSHITYQCSSNSYGRSKQQICCQISIS